MRVSKKVHGKFKSLEEYQLSLGNLQEVRSHFDDRARDPAIACHKEKKWIQLYLLIPAT